MSLESKMSGTNIRDGEDYLSVQETKEYASVAGTLLYHALDRPDLQFAVGRLMSAVTKPQRVHGCSITKRGPASW